MSIIAREDEPELPLSYHYFEEIERLIISGLIENKNQWRERMSRLQTNEEAEIMIKELQEQQPQIGYHSSPHDVRDAMQATKYAVDHDNFQEWKRSQKES